MVCVDVDAEPVKLVCWDTTGQVRTMHFALLFVLFFRLLFVLLLFLFCCVLFGGNIFFLS